MYLCAGYYTHVLHTNYVITWTTPHCVLTLRLIGLAFDVYDGHRRTVSKTPRHQNFAEFSLNQRHYSFCGTRDAPVLDLYWFAPRVSKPWGVFSVLCVSFFGCRRELQLTPFICSQVAVFTLFWLCFRRSWAQSRRRRRCGWCRRSWRSRDTRISSAASWSVRRWATTCKMVSKG